MKSAPRVTTALKAYAALVWGCALAAVLLSWSHRLAPRPWDMPALWTALSLLALIAVAGALPVTLTPKIKLHVAHAPLFTAILLYPVPLAALLGAGGVFAYHVWLWRQRRRTGFDLLFNTGRVALEVAAAGLLLQALAPAGVAGHGGDPKTILAVLAAALAGYAANVAGNYGAAGLVLRQDPLRLWWRTASLEVPQHAAVLLFGYATTLVVGTYPIFALALLVSFGTTYVSMRASVRLQTSTRATVEALADAVDLRLYGTAGHSERVAELAGALARRLGRPGDEVALVQQAGRVHDIGKIGLSDAVLRKPAPLTDGERLAVQQHVELGWAFLGRFPDYRRGRELVRLHHERPDGRGYPLGLRDGHIPLLAALLAVAEAYESMTSERVYRRALSPEQACAELVAGRGTAWQATAVDALLAELRARGVLAPETPAEGSGRLPVAVPIQVP
jgi:hypothetical protein